MYTYNIFCFGHQLEKNPDITDLVYELDLVFKYRVGDLKYSVEFPYHGGKCDGDIYSIIFGVEITDNDFNPDFIDQVRNAKEEDYKEGYNLFLDEYKKYLNDCITDDEDEVQIKNIIEFLDNYDPKFYSVEVSS